MGMIYSAVKKSVKEAWCLGKDNSQAIFVELFPVAKFDINRDLNNIVKGCLPEYWMIGETPFVVSELYPTPEEFLAAVKKIHLCEPDEQALMGFYAWADGDEISIIGDFGDYEEVEGETKEYVYMDDFDDGPGRPIMAW